MNRYYASVDPGINGAIAIFHESGNLETVLDIPSIKISSGKKEIDVEELYSMLLNYKILHAYIESVHSMPGQGVVGVFSFGHTLGAIKGVLAGSGIQFTMITPQRWKGVFNLIKKDKDMAREKVLHMMPSHKQYFLRKKDCDRADAVLIGLCGMGQRR